MLLQRDDTTLRSSCFFLAFLDFSSHSCFFFSIFFHVLSSLLCLRVFSFFLFMFSYLLGRPFLLFYFDIAHFKFFIEILSCRWLTLHSESCLNWIFKSLAFGRYLLQSVCSPYQRSHSVVIHFQPHIYRKMVSKNIQKVSPFPLELDWRLHETKGIDKKRLFCRSEN